MSITIITDNSFIGSGVQGSVPADSYVYVAESATVANTDTGNGNADGAIATGDGNVTIEVDGTVIASGYTIKLGSDGNDSGNTVIIGETGMVRSVTDFALAMYSDAMSIENSGTIRGVGGIAQLGYNTGPSTISNSGRIIATYAAI